MTTESGTSLKRARNGDAPLELSRGSQNSQSAADGVSSTPRKTRGSRIFQPFRVLGLVSNDVPFALSVQANKAAMAGPSVNILTCSGRSWLNWEAGKMGLVMAGTETPVPITALAVHRNDVFAAAGPQVIRFRRGKQIATYDSPDTRTQILKILLFGEQLLALTDRGILVWAIDSQELEGEMTFPTSFIGTTFLHPSTYVNKVLVGSTAGDLALYNTRTLSLIHLFKAPNHFTSAVTSLSQSPAVDVVGVGHRDGSIRVLDIRQDEQILVMRVEVGAVLGLAFRMDGPPVLAASTSTGTIAIFDLSKQGRAVHTMRDAHEGPIEGLEWVTGQPLLISSSSDNSVKQWVCDTDLALPRLLKSRSGHRDPLTCVRHLGDDGKQVLSASRDGALRNTSVVRDARSAELSQGSIQKKASNLGKSASEFKIPPVVSIASSSNRRMDFEDVVTISQNEQFARTWRSEHKKIGRHALNLPEGTISAVEVSACGNFAMVGSSVGELAAFNLESGKRRRSFYIDGASTNLKGKGKKSSTLRSRKCISGLALDALNRYLVASTLDGYLYIFDFHTAQIVEQLQMPAGISRLQLQRDSGLIALVHDDGAVRIVDLETRKTVRELPGGRARILDMSFSADSRLLITASLDSVIRTYDLSTGFLIDRFRVSTLAISLSYSPTADFLATAHADSNGVFLWSNKLQFSDVPFLPIDETAEASQVEMPTIDADVEESEDEVETALMPSEPFDSPEQLSEDLLTLTLLPSSRWKTLLNLETINARNKPKEPPKAPEQAPFFLQAAPTAPGLGAAHFDVSSADNGEDTSKRTGRMDMVIQTEFTRLARENEDDDTYESFFRYVKSLSPAAIDYEIRSLLSLDDLSAFLRALIGRLRSKRDVECVQALLRVTLDVHSDVLIANSELSADLKELLEEHKIQSERIRVMSDYALGTISFLRQ